MRRINLWIVDHPISATVAIAVVTLFFLFQIPKLVIDTSAEGMMLEKDPSKAYYDGIKKKFGSDNLTIVLLKTDDVFTAASLDAIKRLSEAIERIEGVSRVESLTTVNNIKGEKDTLNTEPLVGATVPEAPEELARIRRDALANPIFVGNIVSKEGKAAAVNVYTDPRPGDTAFNARFSARVDELIRQERGRPNIGLREAYQIGTPVTKVTFGEYIKADQTNLVPISLAVLLVILYLAFRMLQGVVVPVTTGLLSIVWSLGLMAIFGYPVTVVTAIIPSLLIAIGFTEDVHMMAEYHHHLESGKPKLAAIRAMAADSALPILITTLTTVLGFGSLITSDITMLIQFGYASSMALIANFVVTLCVLPAMLRVWPVPRRIRRLALEDESGGGAIARLMTRVGEFNLHYKVPIAVVTVVLCLASFVGWARLKVNTDFVSYFPESSFIRQRTLDLHRSMSGAANFYVVVETGREDGVKHPTVLRAIVGMQEFLASTGRMDKSVSVADYVKKMHREMNDGDPKFDAVPDSQDVVAQYLLTLALTGAGLENAALEIRHLQRTEVLEVEEPFAEGQKGSSAMPHKVNPVGCEQICGLARLLRTNALAALENVALWHERDISHSSVERVILPDSTILLDYLLHRFTEIVQGLRVYPERMRENLERSAGLLASQRVLLALTDKGLSREEAYRLVQGHAMRAREEGAAFAALLRADPGIRRHLSEGEIAACLALEPTLAHVDTLFERVGLLESETE